MNKTRNALKIDYINRLGYTGKDVNIAVLDTGTSLHPDLKSNLIFFKDFVGKKNFTYDDNSHGTHICGIIGSNGSSSNGLYKGIAPACGIVSLKVLDKNGIGKDHIMQEGLNWLLLHHKEYNIRVVNISAGTESTSCSDEKSEIVSLVDKLWDSGITVVASAGNNGPSLHSITSPGISRKIITVGMIDGSINSGIGPTHCNIMKPDLVAPGKDIISCSNGKYGYSAKSGTSMSTPMVSGAAALILSYNSKITNQEIKDILCDQAVDMGLPHNRQGFGMLNIIDFFR